MNFDWKQDNNRSGENNRTPMFYLKSLLPDINMIYSEIFAPIFRAIVSVWDHILLKTLLVITGGGLSELFALGLFDTPSAWWKGLAWLIVIDWVTGTIIAIWDGRFDWRVLNEKWRQIIGYVSCCAMVAILSNGFPKVFYYFQYIVYVSFFIKEGISILHTFKFLTLIAVVAEKVRDDSSLVGDLATIKEEIDKRAEEHHNPIGKRRKVTVEVKEDSSNEKD